MAPIKGRLWWEIRSFNAFDTLEFSFEVGVLKADIVIVSRGLCSACRCVCCGGNDSVEEFVVLFVCKYNIHLCFHVGVIFPIVFSYAHRLARPHTYRALQIGDVSKCYFLHIRSLFIFTISALVKQKLHCERTREAFSFLFSLSLSLFFFFLPWKVPAVSLLSLKSSDCCEAVLFSSRPRATAGGEVINMAGKVEPS